MQEPRILPHDEDPRPKSYKKKAPVQSAPSSSKRLEVQKGKAGLAGSSKSKKTSKSSLKADASQSFQHADGHSSDSLPDYSSYNSDYRELRHKYLVLEEESFSLDRELSMVDSEIQTLQSQKGELLDQLVVLEGLIDPSELK